MSIAIASLTDYQDSLNTIKQRVQTPRLRVALAAKPCPPFSASHCGNDLLPNLVNSVLTKFHRYVGTSQDLHHETDS